MPRVAIKKKDYMIRDLPGWISGRMFVKKLKQTDIAPKLNITQPRLSQMLHEEKDSFTYGDLLTIFKELDATDEEIIRLMRL